MDLLSPKKKSKLSEPLHGRSKKIYVFENGDRFMKCFSPVINPNFLKTWKHILEYLTDKMQPSFVTVENLVNLKTLEKMTGFDDLEAEEKYVALGPNGQFISLKYMTEKEQKLKKKKCQKRQFYTGELDASKKYFFEETEKRGLTVIFIVPNGGTNQEPKKFVFSVQDLDNWTKTLLHIAKTLNIDEIISLSTIFGDPIEESCQLQHGYLYVAVPYNHEFIPCDYAKLFNDGSSPSSFKLKIMPSDQKNMVKFNLDEQQVEPPPKKLSLTASGRSMPVESQSILKLNEAECGKHFVLPDINVTLFEHAMEHKTKGMRDSIVLLRKNSRDQSPGMLARADHLNECIPYICELCDPEGTECPACMGKCDTNVSQRNSCKPCPGECTTPCKEDLICCPECSCIIIISGQRKKKPKCSKSCDYFKTHMESCSVCECDGSKHITGCVTTEGTRHSADGQDGTESPPSGYIIHSSLKDSVISEIHPSSAYVEKQEAPFYAHRESDGSTSGAKVPSQESTRDACSENCCSKHETICIQCNCGSPKETTEPDIDESLYQCEDPILVENSYAAPKIVEEPKPPGTSCADTCDSYRKHGTPCLICECTHKNSESKKTPSLTKTAPSRPSKEQLCNENCEYFLKTGIKYPDCRCDEVDNILQLVILEAQTAVEHCEKEDDIGNPEACTRSKRESSIRNCKDSQKPKEKQRKSSSSEVETCNESKSPAKSKGKRSKGGSCCIPDKKTKASSPKSAVKKEKDLVKDKKSKKSISTDSLEIDEEPKKRIDHNTKNGIKKEKGGSPGMKKDKSCKPGACSANTETLKLTVECKTMTFSDRNTLCCAKQSETTTKCGSMKTLDPILESSSKTTNSTSEAEVDYEGSDEMLVKPVKNCTTACASDVESTTECSFSCAVKEEVIQQFTQIAVGIDDQDCFKQSAGITLLCQGSKTANSMRAVTFSSMTGCSESCDHDERKVEKCLKRGVNPSSCSVCHDGEEHVELPEQGNTPKNSPQSCGSSVEVNVEYNFEENVEDNFEENVEDNFEENVEENVEKNSFDHFEDNFEEEVEDNFEELCGENLEDNFDVVVEDNDLEGKRCDGCLSMICRTNRLGEFCDCHSSADEHTDESEKYILICDSNCDILRNTGVSCLVCECDDSRSENEDLDSHHDQSTCERSVEADLGEASAVDQDTQVGESCVSKNHEAHSAEVCMKNVCYDDCCEVLSNISEDSLESCCMVKAVKEEMRLVKKADCLSVENDHTTSKNKKCRHRECCYFIPNEGCLQGISIKNKMDVSFYGTSGGKQHNWHYSKTKKYKRHEHSNSTFLSETSTAESDRISSEGAVNNYSHKQNRNKKCCEKENSKNKAH